MFMRTSVGVLSKYVSTRSTKRQMGSKKRDFNLLGSFSSDGRAIDF